MKISENENFVCFQYNKKLGFPIYIRFNAQHFDPDISGFLRSMRFEELGDKEYKEIFSKIEKVKNARVLTISEASVMVARQIGGLTDSDKYGPESLIQKNGYSVYRYSNVCMMVFSLAALEWRMGCFSDFGHIQEEQACRIVINRFLSWSLASHGVVGFWGTPVDDGVVVQRAFETKGEAIFFNVLQNKIYSIDGEKRMKHSFSFIKLDAILKDRSIQLKFEDTLSFLTINSTYFGAQGVPSFVRQMIQTLAKNYAGRIFPKENFKPRQEARLE